jgi:anti-sigma B factor antagonist
MWFKKKKEEDVSEGPCSSKEESSTDMIERTDEGVVIVRPEGKIMGGDETSVLCDTLRQLMDEGVMKIVMDFSKVTWINSAGIGVIMGCFTTIRRMGGNMKFSSPSEKVRYYLQITKLNTVFEIFETCPLAVDSFQQSPIGPAGR